MSLSWRRAGENRYLIFFPWGDIRLVIKLTGANTHMQHYHNGLKIVAVISSLDSIALEILRVGFLQKTQKIPRLKS